MKDEGYKPSSTRLSVELPEIHHSLFEHGVTCPKPSQEPDQRGTASSASCRVGSIHKLKAPREPGHSHSPPEFASGIFPVRQKVVRQIMPARDQWRIYRDRTPPRLLNGQVGRMHAHMSCAGLQTLLTMVQDHLDVESTPRLQIVQD